MRRLYQATERESEPLRYDSLGEAISDLRVHRRGKIRTITAQNPINQFEIDDIVNDLVEKEYSPYESRPNSYVVSDFNPDAQFEKDGKMHSVYALQFYWIQSF